MRAVIVSGGAITDYEYIKAQINCDDTIICADSGYDHAAKMGIAPSVVVGDFDSVRGEVLPDVDCIRYPSAKDMTDTELAIEYARGNGFRNFLLIAATGNRLDHTLANILLLKGFLERGENASIVDEHSKILLTDSRLCLHEPIGSIVSLIPLCDCQGVTTENLEYPLHNAKMFMGRAIGVSNITTSESAAVSVEEGILLVIAARE